MRLDQYPTPQTPFLTPEEVDFFLCDFENDPELDKPVTDEQFNKFMGVTHIEYMYRYNNYADIIRLESFQVIKHTPAGKWIDVYGKKKFVLNRSTKRYAHEDKVGALRSFEYRKIRQEAILKSQLQCVQFCLDKIKGATPDTVELEKSWLQLEY